MSKLQKKISRAYFTAKLVFLFVNIFRGELVKKNENMLEDFIDGENSKLLFKYSSSKQ